MEKLDEHGQPENKSFNSLHNIKKALNELNGLCSGLLANGRLEDGEIYFLDTWIRSNKEIVPNWPLNIISKRVNDVLANGIITENERDDLKKTLSELVGGTLQEHGSVSGMATRLPVEKISNIEFDGKYFCFTGKFIYGPREKCETAVIEKGATVIKSITKNIDYLVIGTLSSRDWAHTNHGRKIEKTIKYKQERKSISIVSEETWVALLA